MKTLPTLALTYAFALSATAALAHPHKTDGAEPEAEAEAKTEWPFFGESEKTELAQKAENAQRAARRAVVKLKAKTEDGESFSWDGEDISEASRELEEVFAGMAGMLSEFAADIEIETDEGDGTALMFDGEEMLRFDLKSDKQTDDRLSITGLGRNLTVERETVRQDGQTRTRIVIEMDGGSDVEIDLPEE